MNTIERIKDICNKRNISISRLEKECGFSNASIRKLKDDNISIGRLQVIADYLDVSVQYLVDGEDGYYFNPETASLAQEMYEDRDMRSLFDMKRNMNPDVFKAHMEMMRVIYRAEHPEEFSDDGC